jgi:hypothetical protein
MTAMKQIAVRALLLCVVFLPLGARPLAAQGGKSIAETIEWTWEVTPEHRQPQLPNVALVGDSITRNYFPAVTQALAGKANVYLFAASTSVGDPRLSAQLKEFFTLMQVPFRVVHFNNGMHGWGYTEAEFGAAFPAYIDALRADAPGAKLIWANITPVRKDTPGASSNARVDARNTITAAITGKEHIPLDDQHARVAQHPDSYLDNVHPNTDTSSLEGKQAAAEIEKLLAAQ